MIKMIKKQIAKKKAMKEVAEMKRNTAQNTLDIIDAFGGVSKVPASVVNFCMKTNQQVAYVERMVSEM